MLSLNPKVYKFLTPTRLVFVTLLVSLNLFYFTNCFKVVGTGNPKTTPVNKGPNKFSAKLCAQLETCGSSSPDCYEAVQSSTAMGRTLGLNSKLHSHLKDVDQKAEQGLVRLEDQSLDQCLRKVEELKCQVGGKKIDANFSATDPAILQFVSESSDCKRFVLDHLNFLQFSQEQRNELNGFATPAILKHQDKWLVPIKTSSNEVSLFRNVGGQLTQKATLAVNENFGPLFWKNKEAAELCVALHTSKKVACYSLASESFNPSETIDLKGTPQTIIRDITSIKNRAQESVLIYFNSTDQTVFVKIADQVEKQIDYPSGLQYPDRIVVVPTNPQRVFLFFKGKGLWEITSAMDSGNQPVSDSYVAMPEATIAQPIDPKYLSLLTTSPSSEIYFLTGYSESNDTYLMKLDDRNKLNVISKMNVGFVPEAMAVYKVSANVAGLMSASIKDRKFSVSFLNGELKPTTPIEQTIDAGVLGLQVLDWNQDNRDDILLNSIDTLKLSLLIKE